MSSGRETRKETSLSFGIESLIAVAVTAGIAVIWTMVITVAGLIWQRHEIREFMTSHSVTAPSLDSAEVDDARELVLH
jgi:hypothetical protein